MSIGESEPWHAAFPSPNSIPAAVPRSEVRQWLERGEDKSFILIDLRRNDHEGGTIRGSINLPAQSLYPSIPTVYSVFAAAGIKKSQGSCGGRGTRAAGWFGDYLNALQANEMESFILEGGIKGWVSEGDGYINLMEQYNPKAWKNISELLVHETAEYLAHIPIRNRKY